MTVRTDEPPPATPTATCTTTRQSKGPTLSIGATHGHLGRFLQCMRHRERPGEVGPGQLQVRSHAGTQTGTE